MSSDSLQKEAIISAATSLFARFGLEKTTMEDIARAANKGKSSLYYYFKSKEEVFAEVIRSEINGLKERITRAVEGEENPYEKFRTFVETRLSYLNEKQDQYIAIEDQYLNHYKFIQNLTIDYSKWEIATIGKMLQYGQDRGLFKVVDLKASSRAIYFALKGLEYPWATNLTRKQTERSIQVLVDILLRGISKG